jgi:hypothetical protein
VAERVISVRLDGDAQSALARLTRDGTSQSQAIRRALVLAARQSWYAAAERATRRLAESAADRVEVEAIREFFGDPDAAR